MVEPPEREADHRAPQQLGGRLELPARNRELGLGSDELGEHVAGGLLRLAAESLDLFLAGCVPEDQVPRVRLLADVREPGVEQRPEALEERLVGGRRLNEARQQSAVASFVVRRGETVVSARVENGLLTVAEGLLPGADLLLETELPLVAPLSGELETGEAIESGRIRITGERELLGRFVEIFRALAAPAPLSA